MASLLVRKCVTVQINMSNAANCQDDMSVTVLWREDMLSVSVLNRIVVFDETIWQHYPLCMWFFTKLLLDTAGQQSMNATIADRVRRSRLAPVNKL